MVDKRIIITIFCFISLINFALLSSPPVKRATKQNTPFNLSQNYTEIKLSSMPEIVAKVNAKNKQIVSFICDDAQAKVRQKGLSAKIHGKIYYEKPMNFRFTLKSILGLELDLGSNEQQFWYWSKRDGEPGLHFAKHEDLGKTRLKPSFNPMVMMSSLGLNEILFNDTMRYYEVGDLFVLKETKLSQSTRQKVINSIVINKKTVRIDAFYVQDANTKKLMGSNQLIYENDIIKEII